MGGQDAFLLDPPKQEFPNNQLPLPEVGGPSGANGHFTPSLAADTTVKCGTTTVNGVTTTNFLTPAACAAITENGLPDATDANGLPIIFGGGSYSDCSDPTQPGVKPILNYLKSIRIDSRCEAGHYYLLNNYNPGWFGNGTNAFTNQDPSNTPFTIPPSSTPSIGDDMNEANVSWKYYGDQWNNYVPDPFQYDTSIMSNPAQVAAHIQDRVNLYADIANGTLPAVSFVKPSGYVDGHPSSSKLDLFEGFVQKIVNQVEASPEYTKDTVILITEDEGGGYYDSGYVQPVDFFGDGTRIPLIVVANPQYLPLRHDGYISHQYADHVSILKFIERNWGLKPVSHRSRDNFPNPVQLPGSYAPLNSPALNDLFDFFDFPAQHGFL